MTTGEDQSGPADLAAGAQAGNIVLVHGLRGGEFPFHPSGTAFARFEDLRASGVESARRRLGGGQLGDLDASVDLVEVERVCAALIEAQLPQVSAHVKDHDGTDHVIQHTALDHMIREQVLRDGGGLVVERAERFMPTINEVAGWLAVAWDAPVRAYVVSGAEPTQVLGRKVARSVVVPLNSDVIVRTGDAAPFDLPCGGVAEVAGWPRISAPRCALTVVFVELRFAAIGNHHIIATRARHHALLRLDLPSDVRAESAVYGRDAPARYLDVFKDELALLLERTPLDHARWLWTINHVMAPMPFGPAPGGRFVGRFPGGIGVLAERPDEESLYVRAVGETWCVPVTAIPLLEGLLAGDPVHCDVSNQGSMAVLHAAGAVAEVGGDRAV